MRDGKLPLGEPAQTVSWRNRVKVHPAADLFPMMSDADLRELGKDIQKNGLQFPLIVDDDRRLIDGRNRLAALEAVGALEFDDHGEPWYRGPKGDNKREVEYLCCPKDPYSYVISANILRRHLTVEDKVKLAAELLKARPELSNRQVAEQVKLSHPTIGKVRAELEAAGTVETVTTIVGKDGVAQPAHKPPKPSPDSGIVNTTVSKAIDPLNGVNPQPGEKWIQTPCGTPLWKLPDEPAPEPSDPSAESEPATSATPKKKRKPKALWEIDGKPVDGETAGRMTYESAMRKLESETPLKSVARPQLHDHFMRILADMKVDSWKFDERVAFAHDVLSAIDLGVDDLMPVRAGGR